MPGRHFRRVNVGKVFPAEADIYFRFYTSAGAEAEDEDYSDRFASEEEYVASGVNDAEQAFVDEVQSEQIITVVEELPPQAEPLDGEADLDDRTLRERMDDIIPAEPAPQEEGEGARRNSLVNLSDYLIVDDEVVKYIGTRKITQVPHFITKIGENAFPTATWKRCTCP